MSGRRTLFSPWHRRFHVLVKQTITEKSFTVLFSFRNTPRASLSTAPMYALVAELG